jgi:hypothetical protein
MFTIVLTCALLASPTSAAIARNRAESQEPPELGAVHFGRDLELASSVAQREKKPVFLLFQEIPGCATCRGFGAGPLSHPLIVEAIESEFVPVAIYNNRDGRDKAVLERFSEPAWNNPVVRFLDADGRDLLPRAEGVWSEGAIAARMIAALAKGSRGVPDWLALAAEETEDSPLEDVVFAMHCYWEGQGRLGGVSGVAHVEPGFIGGEEVVRVMFRPRRIAFADLVREAARLDCALSVYASSDDERRAAAAIVGDRAKRLAQPMRKADASEYLYHLQHSHLCFAPLTELQATRVNSDLARGKEPAHWMSPRQRAIAARIAETLRTHPNALDGLQRPARTSELSSYAAELEARLERAH